MKDTAERCQEAEECSKKSTGDDESQEADASRTKLVREMVRDLTWVFALLAFWPARGSIQLRKLELGHA